MPNTARIRMLASSTSALFDIPLLLAGSLSDLLIFAHEFVFGGTPRRDHRVELFRGGAHCLDFGLPVSLLRRNEESQRLAVTGDCQQATTFQVACEVLTKFANANLFSFHIAYSLYTIAKSES